MKLYNTIEYNLISRAEWLWFQSSAELERIQYSTAYSAPFCYLESAGHTIHPFVGWFIAQTRLFCSYPCYSFLSLAAMISTLFVMPSAAEFPARLDSEMLVLWVGPQAQRILQPKGTGHASISMQMSGSSMNSLIIQSHFLVTFSVSFCGLSVIFSRRAYISIPIFHIHQSS